MRRYRMPKPRGSFLGKWTHGRKFIGASSYDEADDMEDRVGLTGEGYDEPLPGGRVSPKVKRVLIGLGVLFVLGLLLVLLWETIANMTLKMQGVPTGLWSKRGKLMIGKDTPFFIKGFSWYGMEEENHVFGGLADTPADAMLKLAVDNNFNAIRVPLAYNNWRNNPDIGTGIDHLMNSLISIGDGHFYYLELLDKMIEMSGKKNILILLDLHRLNSAESELSGLWYSRTVSEDDVIDFWRKVCDRYYRTWNVMGVDITNEPYKGLWDNSKSPNNWKRAAERITNAVHAKCPHWLVMIEGVGKHAETLTDQPFWGENIHAMKHARLAVQFPKKVALSPHVYGPAVYEQPYFKKPDFMTRMPAIWDTHFGNAIEFTDSAVIVGEWGGTNVGRDAAWQAGFIKYLKQKGFGFFYWCLNPESKDTGGLMINWRTPDRKKLAMLETFKGTTVTPEMKRHFSRR